MTNTHLIGEVFFALCKRVDTPVSLGAWLRFRHSHVELASMEINPRDYTNASSFFDDYSVVSFLSKYKGLMTGSDLDAIALQKFATAESSCKETNLRFKRLATVKNSRLHAVLHRAQVKIAKLLGPFSTFAIRPSYGWGPGASVDIKRRRAFIDTKISELPISVSRSARAMLRNEIETDLHWSESILGVMPEGAFCLLNHVFDLVDECRVDTVPKNAKTNRIIAIEPRGNSFLQKGFGGYFRDRLRSVGIDLNDQSVNQHLACQAELGGLSTLDLKAASDTVSKELVWALFPYEWASAMDAVRSRRAAMPDGSSVVLEKFSSMGNGFTFELESLIFWALADSVDELSGTRGVVAVYGDDIIVRRSVATDLCLVLQFCGFEVNDSKSFIDGSFYESCGKHFFHGYDVTPAFQKEVIESPQEAIRCGNRLLRLGFRWWFSLGLDERVLPAREVLRRSFRDSCRWEIPFGSPGDDGWMCTPDEVPRTFQRSKGLCLRVFAQVSVEFPANDNALLAWSMRRGVKTEVPYMGVLSRIADESQLVDAYRLVI